MSKYDQYIREFLLKNSELSVEKIGTFVLNSSAADEKVIQPQFVTFHFNKRAQTSEALVEFIAAETGKNKTLITSDLSSLFEDGRQYANIGKPFPFADIGIISLNRQGEYEFIAGAGNVSVSDSTYNLKTNAESTGRRQTSRNAVILIAFIIIILVAGGIGWGIYKYIYEKKSDIVTNDNSSPVADSNAVTPSKPAVSTAAIPRPQDSVTRAGSDSAYFKFIVETTSNRYRAYNRYDSLKSWKDKSLLDSVQHDSIMVYHIFLKLKLPPKDTAYVRDSLQKYYARPNPVRIVPN